MACWNHVSGLPSRDISGPSGGGGGGKLSLGGKGVEGLTRRLRTPSSHIISQSVEGIGPVALAPRCRIPSQACDPLSCVLISNFLPLDPNFQYLECLLLETKDSISPPLLAIVSMAPLSPALLQSGGGASKAGDDVSQLYSSPSPWTPWCGQQGLPTLRVWGPGCDPGTSATAHCLHFEFVPSGESFPTSGPCSGATYHGQHRGWERPEPGVSA